jgi:hypothetical protein
MQAHVRSLHKGEKILLCECDLEQKYCSLIVKFCYQKLINDEWKCLPHEHVLPPADVSKKSQVFTVHKGPYRPPNLQVVRRDQNSSKEKVEATESSSQPDLRQQLQEKSQKRRLYMTRKHF